MDTTYDLLVLNGIVVTHMSTGEFDIAVKDEKIVNIVPRGRLLGATAKTIIDAERAYVMVSL